MASVEGLAKVQGLIQGTNDQLDQQTKMAAAKQAADMFKAGDIKGALSTLAAHDPDHAQQLINQFQQFDPTTQQNVSQGREMGSLQGQTQFGANPRQMLDTQLSAQKEMLNSKLNEKKSEASSKVQAQPKSGGLTPGEISVDKAFAKEYTDFIGKGGYTQAQKNLQSLKDVSKEIVKTDTATGGFIGLLPKVIRDVVTPEGASLQDKVEQVIQSNLRQVLGAQFTEREGQMLLARSYNPRLSEKENKSRLDSLVTQIEGAYKAQKDAARYFEDHGTLKGFKGKIVSSIDDIIPPPTDKHQQALEFIAANPDDPRVPAIRKKLGLN